MTDIEILSQLQILLQVTIAIILGGIIGFERERREKPAGFRTNMVVGGASALFIILGRYIVTALQQDLPPDALGVDPTRILYAVIFGVSFIGAGTIIKDGPSGSIENLTTACHHPHVRSSGNLYCLEFVCVGRWCDCVDGID